MADMPGVSGADITRIANNGLLLNQQIGSLINALTDLLPFSGATGTFTCSAAATTIVIGRKPHSRYVIL